MHFASRSSQKWLESIENKISGSDLPLLKKLRAKRTLLEAVSVGNGARAAGGGGLVRRYT